MKHNYIGKCLNTEDTINGNSLSYSSNLIMIYIEQPGENKEKIVWCYTLEELKSFYLAPENRFMLHESSASDSNKYIYSLSNGTYVDSSIIECMENRNNTMKLVFNKRASIYKSFGVSSVHDLMVNIYKAIPVSRCSVLSNINPDCKEESDYFDPNASNAVDEEDVDVVLQNTMDEMLDTVWSLSKAEELSKKREEEKVQRLLNEEKKIMNEVIVRDNSGRVIEIKRYVKDTNNQPYSNASKPSVEYFNYNIDPVEITKIWKNIYGEYSRDNAPAYTKNRGDVIVEEKWFIDNIQDREDGPNLITRYYPSGNNMIEYWNDHKYVQRQDNAEGSLSTKVSPLSYGAVKIETWHSNGKLSFVKDRNVLRFYRESDGSCYCKITRTNNPINSIECIQTLYIPDNPLTLRIMELEKTFILTEESVLKRIYHSGANVMMYNFQDNRARVSKYFSIQETEIKSVSGDAYNIENRLVLDNNSGIYAVKVFGENNSDEEVVSYDRGLLSNNNIEGEQTPAIILYSKEGRLAYSVLLNPDEKQISTTSYTHGNNTMLTCNKKTSYDGKILSVDKHCSRQLRDFKVNLSAIAFRDKMDYKYIYHEYKLWNALKYIKDTWNDVNLKAIENLVSLFSKDYEYSDRIFNNCQEYNNSLYSEEKVREHKNIENHDVNNKTWFDKYYTELMDSSKDDNSAPRSARENEYSDNPESDIGIDFDDVQQNLEQKNEIKENIENDLSQVRDIPLFNSDGSSFGNAFPNIPNYDQNNYDYNVLNEEIKEDISNNNMTLNQSDNMPSLEQNENLELEEDSDDGDDEEDSDEEDSDNEDSDENIV